MPEQPKRVVSLGEVMVEMTRGQDSRYALACGGDTFNTAVYLARAGIPTAYATGLGDDHYSDRVVALAEAEGVQHDLMVRVPGRLPGLYLIETDDKGERKFFYWRDNAPARELFELPDWPRIAEALVAARMVYFSGITLGIYSNAGLGRFLAALEMARANGAIIVFDGNFRPRVWKSDVERTRKVFTEALKRVDIALPTFDDEALLWGDSNAEATAERLKMLGVKEIVIKNGPDPALLFANGEQRFVPVNEVVVPVDTTAAGDSFNAGYLAARLLGEKPEACVEAAHKLASEKIKHRGAIMPRAAMAH